MYILYVFVYIIYVYSNYTAIRCTYDHRAEDLSEQARIQQAGGFFARSRYEYIYKTYYYNLHNVCCIYYRVLGILAVTRSFGDHGMKEYVTAVPHISVHPLEGHASTYTEVPFLILACDGLWDVLTDQEAVDLVLGQLQGGEGGGGGMNNNMNICRILLLCAL